MTAERFRAKANDLIGATPITAGADTLLAFRNRIAAALAEAVETERREIKEAIVQGSLLTANSGVPAFEAVWDEAIKGIISLIDARGSRP